MVWATSTFSSSAALESSCLHPPEATASGKKAAARRRHLGTSAVAAATLFVHGAEFLTCHLSWLQVRGTAPSCRLSSQRIGTIGLRFNSAQLGFTLPASHLLEPSFVYCSPSQPFDCSKLPFVSKPELHSAPGDTFSCYKFVKARAGQEERGCRNTTTKGWRSVT